MKKWYVLALTSLTSLLVYAMPALSLPVLFTEIAADLDLSLVQIGFAWGAASLTGFIVSIPFGALGDRLGPRKMLTIACFLVGIFGALRGLSVNFTTFMITVLLHGFIAPAIPPNLHKAVGVWFPQRRGFAAGMVSAGFALGLTLGSSLSATVFSPWFGGWDGVMYFYGAIGVLFGMMWLSYYPQPESQQAHAPNKGPYLAALRLVTSNRRLWLIGLGTLCFWACYRGFTGYLPLYLKEIGWNPAIADQALAAFYAISLIGVIPLSLLSDRYKVKREIMFTSVAVIGATVLSLSFAEGVLIWVMLLLGGLFFDAYMAIHQAAIQEVEGIGFAVVGMALGFNATLRDLGGFIGPPIGNALASYGLSVPFLFWGSMGLLGAVILWRLPTLKFSVPST